MNAFLRRLVLVIVLTIICIGGGLLVSQQGGRLPIRADLIATTGITDFTWSPDGKNIAYVSMQSGTSDIWMVPASGGTPRRLVSTPALETQPRWSKDGKFIAFVAVLSGNSSELHIVNVADQTITNLTESLAEVSNPVWSADSQQIAISRRIGNRSQVIVVDLQSKASRVVADAAASELEWSPDGKWILYVSDPLLTNDQRRENTDIFMVPSDGGVPRLLTPGTPRFRDSSPSWAPDSRQIAYTSDSTGYSAVYTLDTQTGARKTVASGNYDIVQPRWSPDGTAIAYARNEDARFTIWITILQGARSAKLSDRDGVNGGFDLPDTEPRGKLEWAPESKRLAFTHSDSARTSDIWIANVDGTRSVQLTNSMPPELRREGRFVQPDAMTYRSFDGTDIPSLVYKPREVKSRRGHPALLLFRDALDGQLAIGWNPFIQFFVSEGYLVFAPNVRGSSGRGRDYREQVFGHGGDEDIRDAFIGLDHLSSDGLVDTDRVGVFGSGTGGFLTTAALIKDETRFKAAVSINGIVDAVTASSYRGMGVWTRYLIGDSPIASPLQFYERSLVNFVDKLRTPIVFFFTGDNTFAPFQQLQQFAVQAEVKNKWFDYRMFDNEAGSWTTWHPNNVRQTLDAMDAVFDKNVLGHEREIRLSRPIHQ